MKKSPGANFFFTAEQALAARSTDTGEPFVNIYYITPVGNPTGTKLDGADLSETLETIRVSDPDGVFLFDTVYV